MAKQAIELNSDDLNEQLKSFKEKITQEPDRYQEDLQEQKDFISYYGSYTKDSIMTMDEDQIYEYLSNLWAMLIWGNKKYIIDKIIKDNGFENLKERLADLLWGDSSIENRWENFRENIKGMGPAMISEILCKTHPDKYPIWNKKAAKGLALLGAHSLPKYDYQVNGQFYQKLANTNKLILGEMVKAGLSEPTMLMVDYFIWDVFNRHEINEKFMDLAIPAIFEEVFSKESKKTGSDEENQNEINSEFIHNEIRDKLKEIGTWLGFNSNIEQKITHGSKVDTTWEWTIGNMGRVIYVFEVQTKGSIDSLILNLLKSLKNPAVQGVVAVSDSKQLTKIKKHAEDVKDLNDKLKFWDYEEVLKVHENLSSVNEIINKLELVPKGF